MFIATTPRELVERSRIARTHGSRIAVVPTMGALHEGHRALITRAKSLADFVIVTIFVNQLQFNEVTDFMNYPVSSQSDMKLCEAAGVDVVFLPASTDMYPQGFSTVVAVQGLGERFEGASRPGHFDGVTTVVSKLLIASEADVAIFGQKDFQQVAVVKRLVKDLDIPTEIVVEPTVRDIDGLALSSRNVRLSPASRVRSLAISRGLGKARLQFESGDSSPKHLRQTVRAELEEQELGIDYAEIVDPTSLELVSEARHGDVVIVAVSVDGVRLIDNLIL